MRGTPPSLASIPWQESRLDRCGARRAPGMWLTCGPYRPTYMAQRNDCRSHRDRHRHRRAGRVGYRGKASARWFAMTRKRFSIEQIVAALKQAELEMPVADLIRQIGISEHTQKSPSIHARAPVKTAAACRPIPVQLRRRACLSSYATPSLRNARYRPRRARKICLRA